MKYQVLIKSQGKAELSSHKATKEFVVPASNAKEAVQVASDAFFQRFTDMEFVSATACPFSN